MTPKDKPIVRTGLAVAAAVVAAGGAALLYWLPPTEDSWYPRCMFHSLTGLHCPGCGLTRCLHALLHGDLLQAAAYNVLALFFLPPLLVWAGWAWWSALTGRPMPAWRLPNWSILVICGILVAFWVLRNLSFPPFNLLAPHRL